MTVVRAPGKVILWGEYAVLADAPALVMAVDRCVVTRSVPAAGAPTLTRTIRGVSEPVTGGEAARVLAALGHNRPDTSFVLDATELYAPVRDARQDPPPAPRKLGLGSSAAEAAALYALLTRPEDRSLAHLRDIAEPAGPQRGSGSDFVASLLGGLHFVEGPGPTATPTGDGGLFFAMFYTGEPAFTRFAVEKFRNGLAANDVGLHAVFDPLVAAAQEARALWGGAGDSADAALTALRLYGAALKPFLQWIGAWVDPFDEGIRLADAAGGFAKPAGAGGGDCAVAAFDNAAARDAFVASGLAAGFYTFAVRSRAGTGA